MMDGTKKEDRLKDMRAALTLELFEDVRGEIPKGNVNKERARIFIDLAMRAYERGYDDGLEDAKP